MEALETKTWQASASAHLERAQEWTVPYRSRRACNSMHPVYDFLFIYYRLPPAQLEHWHPGYGKKLQCNELPTHFSEKFYSMNNGCAYLDPKKIDVNIRKRLVWSLNICKAVQKSSPQFGCYGLHEWAMVYRGGPEGRARHEGKLPFRLPQDEIDAFVESRPICCSHFDAFRFFTPTAMPFNRIQPEQDTRLQNEQPGCLHTNMDLYKWCAKSMPWLSTELLWDCFQYAVSCRIIDMRASPYNCEELGYKPIAIETKEGRQEYEVEQAQLAVESKNLRERVINDLEVVLGA